VYTNTVGKISFLSPLSSSVTGTSRRNGSEDYNGEQVGKLEDAVVNILSQKNRQSVVLILPSKKPFVAVFKM